MTRGPAPKVTEDELYDALTSGMQPVWTVPNLADHFDVTEPTITKRVDLLMENRSDVEVMTIGQAKAYFVPGVAADPPTDLTTEEQHRRSLKKEFEDKFVGLPTAPWTAVHPNDGPAEGGDKIQLRVCGKPGEWGVLTTRIWENRREELIFDELDGAETDALISGTLYERATVPIEHTNYPPDWDIELNIGGEYHDVGDENRQILVVPGVKNYLVKPCNDAVFLKDVSVDWISPSNGDTEKQVTEITEELLEEVSEWREEHIEAPQGDDVYEI